MDPLIEALRRLKEFLEANCVPYMVIGGIANAVWGQPRYTHDVGLKVALGEASIAEFAALLSEQFRFRYPDGVAFAQRTYVLMIQVTEETPASLAAAFLPYEIEAIARATPTDVGEIVVPICTAEDLIVHKAISQREKDWMDIEGILIRQGDRLDQEYIRNWLDQFAQALERPEIVERYRESHTSLEA
jgi:hypothetical protein